MFNPSKLDLPGTEIRTDDPYSLESLIAWLETKDPAQSYSYDCITGGCLVSLFVLAQTGRVHRFGHAISAIGWQRGYAIFNGKIAAGYPRTFGAALTRAKRALQESRS